MGANYGNFHMTDGIETVMPIYKPEAIYYETSDCLEYVRADDLFYYERIDSFLTLIRDIETGEAVGFKLKGFRYIFQHYGQKFALTDDEFVSVMQAFGVLFTELGDKLLNDPNKQKAYDEAARIAANDNVQFNVGEIRIAA